MSFPRYEKYKDSGVEWLEEVPKGWGLVPIKAIASCNDDVLGETTAEDYEIEYVEISGVNYDRGITETKTILFGNAPSRARRVVKNGDVLISTVRTYLRAIAHVKQPPENLIVSTGFAVIRPLKVSPDFLGYLFHTQYLISEVISRAVGVSYPAINPSELMRLYVPNPSLQEQTQIARFLDHETSKIDALIREQERLIELLQEKRQAVISHAVTKGLDPDVPMKDSGVEWLGEVPAHWEVMRLKYTLESTPESLRAGPFGSSIKGDDFVDMSDYRVYNQSTVISGNFTQSAFIERPKFKELNSFTVKSNDILITTRGTIGRVAIVPSLADSGVIHPCLIRLRVNDGILNGHFLKVIFEHTQISIEQLRVLSNTTTIDVIYSYNLEKICIPVPPREEQELILNYIKERLLQLDSLSNNLEITLSLLRERRSALISAAVTGKIDVRGWQPPADESAFAESGTEDIEATV